MKIFNCFPDAFLVTFFCRRRSETIYGQFNFLQLDPKTVTIERKFLLYLY